MKYAEELQLSLEKRFPKNGTENKFRRIANYLAPQYKGIHLGDLHQVKTDIKLLFAFKDLPNVTSTSDDQLEESDIPLYPKGCGNKSV